MIEAGRWHLLRGYPLRGLTAATVPVLTGLASGRPAFNVDGPGSRNRHRGRISRPAVASSSIKVRTSAVSGLGIGRNFPHKRTPWHDHAGGRRRRDVSLPLRTRNPSRRSTCLEPGGNRIMFMDLGERPENSDRIVVTPMFDRAGSVEVVFPVTRRSSAGIEQDDRT